MFVYIRDGERAQVLREVPNESIPRDLVTLFEGEKVLNK